MLRRDRPGLPDRIGVLTAVMVWHVIELSEDTLRRLHQCRVIVRVGAGSDNIDRAAAGAAGIPVVTMTWETHAAVPADLVIRT